MNEALIKFELYFETQNDGAYCISDCIELIKDNFTIEEIKDIYECVSDSKAINYKLLPKIKLELRYLINNFNSKIKMDNVYEVIEEVEEHNICIVEHNICSVFNDWDWDNGELTINKYCKLNRLDYGNFYKKLTKNHNLYEIKIMIAQLNIDYWTKLLN